MAKYKRAKHKLPKHKCNKIQMQQNSNGTYANAKNKTKYSKGELKNNYMRHCFDGLLDDILSASVVAWRESPVDLRTA